MPPTFQINNLITKTVAELRNICRNKGLYGYSKLRKNELIDAIMLHDEGKAYQFCTLDELRKIARSRNLRFYSNLNRNELIKFIETHNYPTLEMFTLMELKSVYQNVYISKHNMRPSKTTYAKFVLIELIRNEITDERHDFRQYL